MFPSPARTPRTTSGIIFGICFVVSGCALFGGGGGGLPKAKGYEVVAPAAWQSMEKADSDSAYKLGSGNIVTLNSSCTRNSKAPKEVLTKHLLFGARNVEYSERQRIEVAGTEGLLSHVSATIENMPFKLLVFVLPKEGCVFDFSLLSPKEISQSDRQDFLSFIKSFKYGSK